MPMIEGQVDAVIRVDTHVAAPLNPNGGVRATLRCQAIRPAMPGCSSSPTPRPVAGGCGPWRGRAAMGPG
jgi:hypothetical protein